MQPARFGSLTDGTRSGHDERLHMRRHLVAADDARRFFEIREAAVGARPDERDVDFRAGDAIAGMKSHEGERLVARIAVDALADADRLPGIDPPRHRRLDRPGGEADAIVVAGVRVRREAAPPRDRAIERGALRREPAAFQERERRVVRIHVAGARPALDRHVADRHPLFERHAIDGVAAVLVRVADAAPDAEAPDDRQDHVLRVHARIQPAVDVDASHLQRIEREALRCEHVADL